MAISGANHEHRILLRSATQDWTRGEEVIVWEILRVRYGVRMRRSSHVRRLWSKARHSRFMVVATGWLLRSISWWSKRGASHRKNGGHSTPARVLRSALERH